MSDLDGLIDSKISLISQEDVKFDGTLFSINAEESSMVLKNVVCLGTEDRVKDPAKKIPPNPTVIPFVTFPGSEIKDLIVHDQAAPAPAPKQQHAAPKQHQQHQKQQQQHSAPARSNNNRDHAARPPAPPAHDRQPKKTNAPAAQTAAQVVAQAQGAKENKKNEGSGAGTGAHLLKLREKKAPEGAVGSHPEEADTEFDFSAGLDSFKKEEVLGKVAEGADHEVKYKKDDFFDSLSCDLVDRKEGRKTRMTASEERSLNQDTFGAIALQGNRRHYGGRGRGGGRGGGSGRGGSGQRRSNYGNGMPVKA